MNQRALHDLGLLAAMSGDPVLAPVGDRMMQSATTLAAKKPSLPKHITKGFFQDPVTGELVRDPDIAGAIEEEARMREEVWANRFGATEAARIAAEERADLRRIQLERDKLEIPTRAEASEAAQAEQALAAIDDLTSRVQPGWFSPGREVSSMMTERFFGPRATGLFEELTDEPEAANWRADARATFLALKRAIAGGASGMSDRDAAEIDRNNPVYAASAADAKRRLSAVRDIVERKLRASTRAGTEAPAAPAQPPGVTAGPGYRDVELSTGRVVRLYDDGREEVIR